MMKVLGQIQTQNLVVPYATLINIVVNIINGF